MRRARSGRRSSFIDGLISLGLLLALLGATKSGKTAGSPEKPSSGTKATDLASANGQLRRQVDLATGDTFYYTLDPVKHVLRFMYQGNVLFERNLLDVDVGTRRGFLGKGAAPKDWAERVWSSGALEPPRQSSRLELDASSQNYAKVRDEYLVPPTPEEAFPAPEVWRIRYAGGMAVEVHGVADTTRTRPGFMKSLGQQFQDSMKALVSSNNDAVRIRLYLSRPQSDMLYRSVPPDTRFTILPVS
jgi:hypothetical protein